MDLFETLNGNPENLLPYDGTVLYYGKIITPKTADHYFQTLLHKVSWSNDKAIILGKEIITKRKVA